MTAAVEALERRVRSYQASRAVVAYSGGVDSATVVAVAVRALGPEAVEAVTAISPSYPAGELEAARAVAASIGVPHRTIATREVERDAYARNDALRCFHCKSELYGTLQRLVAAEGGPGRVVLAGANADDLADLRPGLRAAEQQGVRNPLLEEDLGKAAVRAVARTLGLTVADKPALACLSSRVAHGIRITPDLLARIDRAEARVRSLGFDVVRVRHLGNDASVEVAPNDVARLMTDERLPGLIASLRGDGWSNVRVDLAGYRQGSLNVTAPA
ncbi:MAG TPA: ATP-dependent sacrificial sulfur transferase LarE [Actinobacteria bacterium]|nr:ATP-dependent sacrificial sulfur transferase LarE [Actinomycetota bacterium]